MIVRRTPDGRISDVTPPGFNVRSRVHEYGGAAYTVDRGTVFFSNFDDQRLYRQDAGRRRREPLTPKGYFYADAYVDAERRAAAVRARGSHARAIRNRSIPWLPSGSMARVEHGPRDRRGFLFGPDAQSRRERRSPGCSGITPTCRGTAPSCGWRTSKPTASLGARVKIAGGRDESIFQPEWSPDGRLYFVSDRTGFWNLYRLRRHRPSKPFIRCPPSSASRSGSFSSSSYAFVTPTRIAATYTEAGRWKMALIETDPRKFEPIDLRLRAHRRRPRRRAAPCTSSAARRPRRARSSRDVAGGGRSGGAAGRPRRDRIDPAWISVPEAITYHIRAARTCTRSTTRRRIPTSRRPAGERPPLLVAEPRRARPTQSNDVLDAAHPVLDQPRLRRARRQLRRQHRLRPRVSRSPERPVGHRRRRRLRQRRAGISSAPARPIPNRLIIRGGSAGGYTTLAALTFHDTFKAGASYYGISDIEVLARDTHKFESRYLDSLIGPYPAAKDLYVTRSPIHFTDRLSCALILFQGLEDKVVPPNQSEMMADAVRKKGLPVAYVTFRRRAARLSQGGEHRAQPRGGAVFLRRGVQVRRGRSNRAGPDRQPALSEHDRQNDSSNRCSRRPVI